MPNGVQVADSSFSTNQLGGVVFHRYVTNGVISRTSSSYNVGDGFTLARATTGIAISESTAIDNSGSGFRLDGRPLAEGRPPSVLAPQYGNNSVSNSTAYGNGEYGIEVLGGVNIGILNNTIDGSGVVVQGPASRISINGNTVSDGGDHGVALLDGVKTSKVTGNVVEGSSTGVFVRDSTAEVEHNTVAGAGSHGVSLIGSVGGSVLAFNRLSGTGASALDTARSDGDISRSSNNTAGWSDTTPFDAFKLLLHPMNALWAVLILVLAVTAIQHRRYRGKISHPYANQLAHAQHMALPEATIDITPTDSPLMWRQPTASDPRRPDDRADRVRMAISPLVCGVAVGFLGLGILIGCSSRATAAATSPRRASAPARPAPPDPRFPRHRTCERQGQPRDRRQGEGEGEPRHDHETVDQGAPEPGAAGREPGRHRRGDAVSCADHSGEDRRRAATGARARRSGRQHPTRRRSLRGELRRRGSRNRGRAHLRVRVAGRDPRRR